MRTFIKTNNHFLPGVPSIFDDLSALRNVFQQSISKTANSLAFVNVKETDTAFELEVAAPGLSKEDFKIELDDQTLTISALREDKKEEKDNAFTRKEFNYSSFKRSFNLPERTVASDKITAKYADGVLHLYIPKLEDVNNKLSKAIPVQ